MTWELLSFILSSEKREKVIEALRNPTTPTRISKETKISKEHVSRMLKEFVKKGIAECKTPDKRKGKVYILTEKGKEILDEIKKSSS